MKLKHSSRSHVFINNFPHNDRIKILKPKNKLLLLPEDSTDIYCENKLSLYTKRPKELEKLTVAEFYAYYNVQNNKSSGKFEDMSQSCDNSNHSTDNEETEKLIRSDKLIYKRIKKSKIFRYNNFKIEENENEYYRSNVFLFHPWRNEDTEVENDNVKNVYLQNEISIIAKREEFEKLYFDDDEINKQIVELESSDDEDLNVNEDFISDILLELAPENGLIQGDAPARFSKVQVATNTEYENLMTILNEKQRKYLINLVAKFKNHKLPIYDFITGGAGVGKSKLIAAIYQTLIREFTKPVGSKLDVIRILVTGPTGKAAYNVKGSTIHSAFSIGVVQAGSNFDNFDNPDTNGLIYSSLKHLKLIITDEISMVGSSVFSKMEKRLRYIFRNNKPFGGISVICFGDFIQLKPVGDRCIFQGDKTNSNSSFIGNPLWLNFKFFKLTQIMRQADDLTFAEALNALGIGEMKEEHIRLLKSRTFDSVDNLLKHNLITENATILTFTRKEMKENNERILNSFKTEGTVNTALDSIVGKLTFRNGKKLNMKKVLETSSKLDESKTYGLTFYLHLKKNARYMITNNIDTLDG